MRQKQGERDVPNPQQPGSLVIHVGWVKLMTVLQELDFEHLSSGLCIILGSTVCTSFLCACAQAHVLSTPSAVGKHSPLCFTIVTILRTAVTVIKYMLLYAFLQIWIETMNIYGTHGSFLEHPHLSLYLPMLWDLLRGKSLLISWSQVSFLLDLNTVTMEIKEPTVTGSTFVVRPLA